MPRDASTHVTWDGHSAESLAMRCGVPRLVLLAEAESTLDVAHQLAEDGSPSGTVVLADYQTAGRGRFGRSWISEPGQGVWVTVLEHPRDAKAVDVLSLRVGLRCAEALDVLAGERVRVKWPNDLVLRRTGGGGVDGAVGKLGGILIEARWIAGGGGDVGTPAWAAIGVGINVVAPQNVELAVGLRPDVTRVAVLSAVVRAVRDAACCDGLLSAYEVARFANRDVLVGRRIVAPGDGVVAGVDPTGALVVATAHGTERHRTGTVRLADSEENS